MDTGMCVGIVGSQVERKETDDSDEAAPPLLDFKSKTRAHTTRVRVGAQILINPHQSFPPLSLACDHIN